MNKLSNEMQQDNCLSIDRRTGIHQCASVLSSVLTVTFIIICLSFARTDSLRFLEPVGGNTEGVTPIWIEFQPEGEGWRSMHRAQQATDLL